MWPNPQEYVDLVTFTEEIFNGKLHFFVQWFFPVSSWVINRPVFKPARILMHFGEMFFFAVRHFDEGNLGTTYIEEFLPLVRSIWILVTASHSQHCYLSQIINACFNITWCLNKVFQRFRLKSYIFLFDIY